MKKKHYSVAGRRGIYAVTWGEDPDNPDYISVAKISKLRRPELLELTHFQYRSKDGPLPFDADIDLQFTLEPACSQTKITVDQKGVPVDTIADEFYDECVQGWIDTLASFKAMVEEN